MNNEFSAFHKAEHNFFSLMSFDQIDYGNMVAYATGVKASGLNPAIVTEVDGLFPKNLTNCQYDYAQKKLPWALVIPEYLYTEQLGVSIKEHFLEFTGTGVAMMALISHSEFPVIDSPLRVREIKGNLNVWSIPLIYGFESTPEVTEVYTQRHELASQTRGKLYHLSGFINDTVVCSLSLSLCENFARIDDVATMPTYQKKGYATQLIYEALLFARHLNINKCFLEASESGLSLYKKLGFNELFINRYYESVLENLS